MRKWIIFALSLYVCFSITSINAQGFTVNVDVVSSYIWRGIKQGSNEPNIQPAVAYTSGCLTLGATGSGNFSGSLKEVDSYATVALSPLFSLTLNDYNWIFTPGRSYFNYHKRETDHILEGSFAYAGIESFPLSVAVNTAFYGADKKAGGSQAFSTYVELNYPIAPTAKAFLGASLIDSPQLYNNSRFAITNVGIRLNKSIVLTDKFSLPIYGILGANLNTEDVFFVAGISF